jgi:uncharacterized membrane protein YdbT with pleckstrin-like domain
MNTTDQNIAASRVPLPADVSVLPDEKVIRVANFHWGIYWKGLVVAAFAVLLLIYVFNLGLFMGFVAGSMLGLAYITKHFMLLILTNKRLLIRTGLLRMDTVQMSLERIESVELERTIPGMLMGYASVVVTGTGSRIMAVPYVENAHIFRRLTDEQIYAETHKPKQV